MVASLWNDTCRVPAPTAARLTESVVADVCVVGGGFTGLSTALHLAEGGTRVVLLEAHTIGYGASGRNGGQASPGLRVPRDRLVQRFGDDGERLYTMSQVAPDFLCDLADRHDLDCSLQRKGVIRLAHSAAAEAAAENMARGLEAWGIRGLRMLDADAVEREVGTRRYRAGLEDPRGASVQPMELARELARAALAQGVQIHVDSPALQVEPAERGWVVRTQAGQVRAERVVVATNAYSDRLVPGLARSVLPVSSFQIATEALSPDVLASVFPGGQTVHDTRRLILYFRRSPDGRAMLGGRASFSSQSDSSDGRADYQVLQSVLHDIFPQLEGVPVTHQWGGLVCITPDEIPHYHEPLPGLHVLLGYCGRGVAMATQAGAWLAGTLQGNADPQIGIPRTALRTMPLHQLREPVLNLVMRYHQLMDRFGR